MCSCRFPSLLPIFPAAYGGIDVGLLLALVATGQQQHQPFARHGVVHPVAGAVVDAHFPNAIPDGFAIAKGGPEADARVVRSRGASSGGAALANEPNQRYWIGFASIQKTLTNL